MSSVNMNNELKNTEDEIIIDFEKILGILWHRKSIIIACFLVILPISALITHISPKKYISEAKILVNKSSSTNLSEINPFVVSSAAISGGGGLSGILGGGDVLSNEIEIMKSPLVIDNVIRENNFKYKKGRKAGQYLEAKSFLNSSINIENVKGTNIITITYKSEDPLVSFNIINSIIKNYKSVYEKINTKKASGDKEFLQKEYDKTKLNLNNLSAMLKQVKNNGPEGSFNSINYNLLSFYDKRINADLNTMSNSSLQVKELENKITIEMEKFKMLKTKLEWSSMVEEFSKDTSNLSILQKPSLLKDFEYSEPKSTINMVLGIIIAVLTSILAVIQREITDKRLTLSDLSNDSIMLDKKNFDLSKIEARIYLDNAVKYSVLSFADKGLSGNFISTLKKNISDKEFTGGVSVLSIKDSIKYIENFDKIIFLAKIGSSDRKIYKLFREFVENKDRSKLVEVVIK